MFNKSISLTVNGAQTSIEIDSRLRLADLLRDKFGLTGTHIGCGTGNCGACTVSIDGRTAKSCCVLAVDINGAAIVTIEGIARENNLHPVQDAFVENHGLQCGFCTPGMILSTIQLIGDNPAPTEDEIRDAISGNICRCTGYVKIVEAIKDAAHRMAKEQA
jgi:aerobic carbon-monoxide dehydrogenase small subunit